MTFRVLFNDRVNGPSGISKFSNKIYEYHGRRFREGEIATFDESDRPAIEALIASDTLGAKRGRPCAVILDEEAKPAPTRRQQETISLADAQKQFDEEASESFGGKVEQVQERSRKTAKELRAEVLGK